MKALDIKEIFKYVILFAIMGVFFVFKEQKNKKSEITSFLGTIHRENYIHCVWCYFYA